MKDRDLAPRTSRMPEVTGEHVNAVDMVRRIRDTHYELLRGKTRAEKIAFWRTEAAQLERDSRSIQHK